MDYEKEKDYWDKKLRESPYRLEFVQKDIEYVIVSKNDEIPLFVDLIKDKYGNTRQTQTLLTRLISKEQIGSDF